MIAVMMRIEDEAHRELSHLANVCEAGFGAVGKVRVDHEDEVIEDDETVVAVPMTDEVALAKRHARRDLLEHVLGGDGRFRMRAAMRMRMIIRLRLGAGWNPRLLRAVRSVRPLERRARRDVR